MATTGPSALPGVGTTTKADSLPAPDRGPTYGYHVDAPVPDDRVTRVLSAFATILEFSGYSGLMESYAHSAANCGRCVVTCPVFQVSGDERDIPCNRSHLLLDVYKRHFTPAGWVRAHFGAGRELTPELVDEMAESFWRCTACRKCTLECPLGIDHGLITHLGRYVLSMAGIAPKALQVSVREQLEGETHNTSKISRPALGSTLEFLAEELADTLGIQVVFPVDQVDRDFVFFCAVSDYLMEPETLMGNAAVLYAAGDWDRWTIGSQNFDAINYGLFYNDWHLERIISQLVGEVSRLRGRKILVGECGHASRSAKEYVPVFSEGRPTPVVSFLEYTLDCIERGKIELDPGAITERVTYHDPCNVARSGWLVEQPRRILTSFVADFVDMEPNGRQNYCCGGGGGLVSIDELHDFRMTVAGKAKADQLRSTGASICIAPCANCKKQLKELVAHYEIPCRVMGLHDLILRALIVPGGISPAARQEKLARWA